MRWDIGVNYFIENGMLESLAFRCELKKKKRHERHTDANKIQALEERDRPRRNLEEREREEACS